jgi:hypothetical protein
MGRIHLWPSSRPACIVRAWPTAHLGVARAAARHACSAAATSPTREVAGYALGEVALDSDREAAAVLTGALSDGRKERRRCGAWTARQRGPVGNGEGWAAASAWRRWLRPAAQLTWRSADRQQQRTAVGSSWRWGGTEEQRRRCACGGMGSGAALGPRAWHARTRGSFGHGASRNGSRSDRVYTRAHGVGQRRPARPIGARHCATLTMTSGPTCQRFSNLNKLRNRSLAREK